MAPNDVVKHDVKVTADVESAVTQRLTLGDEISECVDKEQTVARKRAAAVDRDGGLDVYAVNETLQHVAGFAVHHDAHGLSARDVFYKLNDGVMKVFFAQKRLGHKQRSRPRHDRPVDVDVEEDRIKINHVALETCITYL